MRYSEGRVGRVIVVRLEDGDRLPDALETLAAEKCVERAMCIAVGGINSGGQVVVGPTDPDASPIDPMVMMLAGVHEISAVGTLFPDDDGRPRLHMHAALGRGAETRTGCVRLGVEVWQVCEIILLEIVDNTAARRHDPAVGFAKLEM